MTGRDYRPRSSSFSANRAPHAGLRPCDLRLFRDLTHLSLTVVTAPPVGIAWQPWHLYASCPSNLGHPKHRPYRAACNRCASRHLSLATEARCLGHCFRGECGTRTFLMPLAGASGVEGVAALRGTGRTAGGGGGSGQADDGAERARADQFHRAMLLLRALAAGAALRSELGRQRADLARVNRLLAYHRGMAERLRGTLRRAVPSMPGPRHERSEGSQASGLVHGLLEQVQRDSARPLTLSQRARERGMNASYLSSLFAREVGVPFKSYLTAIRLQRAQELLRDPRRRISDIAIEVGYASPDRFRSAFRRWTGVPASAWREIQQAG